MYRTTMRGREKVFHIDCDASLDDITIGPFFYQEMYRRGATNFGLNFEPGSALAQKGDAN